MSIYSISLVLLFVPVLFLVLRRRSRPRSLEDLPGPEISSWLFGHEKILAYQSDVGEHEFPWTCTYGDTFRTKGCFGQDILMTIDPQIIRHIFQTSPYDYSTGTFQRTFARMMMGYGLIWAQGEVHRRQRKIMNNAFTAAQIRLGLPLIQSCASQLSEKWKHVIQSNAAKGLTENRMNVLEDFAWTTLNILGEVVFDYHFDSLHEGDNELVYCFRNLLADTTVARSQWFVLFRACWRFLPQSIIDFLEHLPVPSLPRLRRFKTLADNFAKELLKKNIGEGHDDKHSIISLLIASNLSEDQDSRMREDEVRSQIKTLWFAGHDTTASMLSWTFYELAKHPDIQASLREEIAVARRRVIQRGDKDFSLADFESMELTIASLKETLRYHPIGHTLTRLAVRDDVIPLSSPIRTVSGRTISEIPISKGQEIAILAAAYNRRTDLWGEDASEWNPRRWLNGHDRVGQTSVGVYANLMSFGAGAKHCIGWRLALLEMQCIAVELIENFSVSLPGNVDIQRVASITMLSMVRGREAEGVQLPLCVSLVQD